MGVFNFTVGGREHHVGWGSGGNAFQFRNGDGADVVHGFRPGVDDLHILGSPRTVAMEDCAEGVRVFHNNGLGGAAGEDCVTLVGVKAADLAPTDWVFN